MLLSTGTRLEITAAVSILCRDAKCPTMVHRGAWETVLRCRNGTKDHVLKRCGGSEMGLKALCDAYLASDREETKSTAEFS